MIAINVRKKQQVFDTDPKAIHQINFTGNRNQRADATKLFIIKEAKETVFCKELQKYCECVPYNINIKF